MNKLDVTSIQRKTTKIEVAKIIVLTRDVIETHFTNKNEYLNW
jgi:hypothetical protein